jgi:hypothetical protein
VYMSRVWIPNLGALPIIASVSLTHNPCLLGVCVVCVCFLLYLSFYLCCVRCVFCVLFCIYTLLFPSSSTNSIDTYVTVPIDIHIALLMYLSSSSFCISTCVIHAYVYVNFYKHFLPLSHSYTTIAISICIYVMIIVQWHNINIPIAICLYVPADRVFARCLHTCDSMFKGLYFNIHMCLCFLWIYTYHVHRKTIHFCMHLPFPYVSSLTSFLSGYIPSVLIPSTCTRARVMCACVHQDSSIQINRIHVNKWMRNKIHIYACIRIHIKCT